MRNPDSPQPPRLTTDPIPLPAQWTHAGAYQNAGLIYDLDRIMELPFVAARIQAQATASEERPADMPDPVWERATNRRTSAALAAYCCEGIYVAGERIAGELDSPSAWRAVPYPLTIWAIGRGLEQAQAWGDAPFQVAATEAPTTAPDGETEATPI